MVHALQEAHRVLQPNAILIDLRPMPIHRRVGIFHSGKYQPLGVMRERLDEDRAANRAVGTVLQEKLFRPGIRLQFNCNRVMDSLDEFREWLDEFTRLGNLASHDWLVRRLEQAWSRKRGKARIVVSGPLKLQVLKKLDSPRT